MMKRAAVKDPTLGLIGPAREMLARGQTPEEVLSYAKQQGASKLHAIKLLAMLTGCGLAEAKRTVHFSQAWADVRARDEAFQEALTSDLESVARDDPSITVRERSAP